MKSEFSGKDNDAIEIIKSIENNPVIKLKIYSLEINQYIGDSWFVIDILEKAPNDYWIFLFSENITKHELAEIKVEIKEGMGDRRKNVTVLRSYNLVRFKFEVIGTLNKI